MGAYTLEHEGFQLQLRLLLLSSVAIHEETVPSLLTRLLEEVMHAQVLKDPVVVEDKHYVVLDGMHRVEVLKRLACNLAPCCVVDYSSEKIKVDRWCRCVRSQSENAAVDEIISLSKKRGHEVHAADSEADARDFTGNAESLTVGSAQEWYTVRIDADSTLGVYRSLRMLESDLRRGGYLITYECEEAIPRFLQESGNAVIEGPIPSKREIVDAATSGMVYPPKSTRHILPVRPLNVGAPLSLLKVAEANLNSSNVSFLEHLQSRKVDLSPPGRVIEGRYYAEALYVFGDGARG